MTDFEKILLAVAPNSKAAIRSGFAASMLDCMARGELYSNLRLAHFIAQCAHESAGITTTTELASGRAYEGRKDLGNIIAGDGPAFKGRGLIQNTGRANYTRLAKVFGVDFVSQPAKMAAFPWAATTAAQYWKDRNLNASADRDDIRAVTLRVNGGENGLASRTAYLAKAKHALSDLKGALIAGAAAETQKAVVKAKVAVAPATTAAAATASLHPAAQSPIPSIVIVALVAAAVGCVVALVFAIRRHQKTAAALTAAANGA
jgi:putative chitinase